MRVALLSDMHGNAVGLDAVLAEWAPEPVDEIVSLGDVAQGGAQPAEVVDRLRGLGCRCVFGNADEFLLTLDVDTTGEEVDEEARERNAGRRAPRGAVADGLRRPSVLHAEPEVEHRAEHAVTPLELFFDLV